MELTYLLSTLTSDRRSRSFRVSWSISVRWDLNISDVGAAGTLDSNFNDLKSIGVVVFDVLSPTPIFGCVTVPLNEY